jgi:hypothetical protein
MNTIENKTSYKTEENLVKAIEKRGWGDHRYLIVCDRQGRFTAIFPAGNVLTNSYGIQGDLAYYARHGLMTFG